MTDLKFCCVYHEEMPKMIALRPGDSREAIIKAFGLILRDYEDIFISDRETGSIIEGTDLFDLISSLQRPTDMQFMVQRYRTDLSISSFNSMGGTSTLPLEMPGIIPISLGDSETHTSSENCAEEPEAVEEVVMELTPRISNEVYHFGTFENLRSFINHNIPGLIETSKDSLSSAERVTVSKEIIQKILDDFPSIELQKSELCSLSNAITTIFPFETSATYYIPYGLSGKNTPVGKLYQQYTQYRRKLASRGVIKIRERKTKSQDSTDEPPNKKQLDVDSSESLALAILKTEVNVDDDRVINAWKCTSGYRKKRLASAIATIDLLSEFPILSQKDSYKLAILDFEEIVGKQVKIQFPDNFCENVIGKLTRNQTKLSCVSKIITQIGTIESGIHKNILALHLLAYKFECTNDSKKRRLSKIEKANALIQFVDSFEDIKTFEAPCLALVGEPPILVVDIIGRKSYFKDLLLGLKAFIAFHFAFNIEYLVEAVDVWYFVQYFVFEIKPEKLKKGVNETLAKDLGFNI